MQPRTCTLRLWNQSFLLLILSVSAVLSASAQTPESVEAITDTADTNLHETRSPKEPQACIRHFSCSVRAVPDCSGGWNSFVVAELPRKDKCPPL